jgi:hypothetical protein
MQCNGTLTGTRAKDIDFGSGGTARADAERMKEVHAAIGLLAMVGGRLARGGGGKSSEGSGELGLGMGTGEKGAVVGGPTREKRASEHV